MTTYSTDPALYIFTSLTAGSSHIVTATSRLETILRANRVPFKAVDIATDQKARMLWGRRAGKDEGGRVRKLPGLVQEGLILGDIVEIEDWNEYGELKQHVKIYYDEFTIPNIHHKHPEPLLKKRPVKKSAAAAIAAGASASTTASAPAASTTATPAASAAAIPTPPPLPEPKAATTSDDKATTSAKATADKPKAEEKAMPIRSVADEAAAKAKELRLKSLREKVHGKEGAAEIERQKKAEAEGKPAESAALAAAAAAATAPPVAPVKKDEEDDDDSDESSEEDSSEEDSEEDSSDEEEDEKTKAKPPVKTVAATPAAPAAPTTPKPVNAAPSTLSDASSSSESESESESDSEVVIPSTKPPGLQSMSGTWRHGSQQDDPARETLQSPTSGKWGQGATVGETTTLHGAELRTASEAEIKAIECENVIKEEPELEEEEEKEEKKNKEPEKKEEDEEKKDKA
ncbi:hypothetical protein CC79DRAFT_1370800 [Sarocladium strictum]